MRIKKYIVFALASTAVCSVLAQLRGYAPVSTSDLRATLRDPKRAETPPRQLSQNEREHLRRQLALGRAEGRAEARKP